MTIVYALLMICVLIFFHELGHFTAAKAVGVKVNEFALGMGPKLLKFQKGETLYSIRALPIGGFCAMEGEDEESEDPKAFNNKKLWQKAIIIIAGSFMNLIIAILLIMVVNYSQGLPIAKVESVLPDSPAAVAGVQNSDKLVSINGVNVESWEEFNEAKANINEDTFKLSVDRNGEIIDLDISYDKSKNDKIIGITPMREKSLGKAIAKGPSKTFEMAGLMYKSLGQLVSGKVSVNELSGPVGIVYMVKESINTGGIMTIYLMALISLNLAIINMLPLPALDGGRLVMSIIRRITGKAISDRAEGWIHAIGLLALLGLTIYVTYNDILKFILPLFKG